MWTHGRRYVLGASLLMVCVGDAACSLARSAPPSGPQALRCNPPLEPHLRTDLYVGAISDSAWSKFVDDVLVKEFPVGGTIIANGGWWRRPNGTTGGGRGKTLILLAPARDSSAHRAATRNVIAEIKSRFREQSVGWEEDWVCVNF